MNQSDEYATYLFSDRAEKILKNESKFNKPVFIYLSHTAPHLPHDAPDDLIAAVTEELKVLNPGRTITREAAIYQAMIRAIDLGIEQLHQAAKTLTRETIIIFGSDNGATSSALRYAKGFSNGYQRIAPDHDKSFNGCNYPLKGKKASLSEGGVRIRVLNIRVRKINGSQSH